MVPVGLDQQQHVEIAREIGASFNAVHGRVLTLPEPLIDRRVATIPGLDGRKMSKSYGNVVPIFAEPDELRRLVGLLDAAFGPARVTYRSLMADPAKLERLLAVGAECARERATPVIDRVRAAVGLG